MTNSNWIKLKDDARGPEFAHALDKEIKFDFITESEAYDMGNETTLYGLVLTNLEQDFKAVFQKHAGLPYPEDLSNEMEKIAYDYFTNLLTDKDIYGPSIIMQKDDVEILVVTEKAIMALGQDPSEIKYADITSSSPHMTDTNWRKIKKADMKTTNYSDGVMDSVENELISTTEAKAFLNSGNQAYGLILTQLEDTLKETFQEYTGAAYPDIERTIDGIEKVAYEALSSYFENDADKRKYGPSFQMFIDEENTKTEILVVTEKAIKAFGIDPSTLPEMEINVQSKPTSKEPEPPPNIDVTL